MKNTPGDSELRLRAEKELHIGSGDPEALSEMTPEKMASLIHELQVHQIELKMQNDELRRVQNELEETRDKYSHLYDFAPIGYFSLNQKGTIVAANLTVASMLGVERSALIGQPFSRFILRDDQDSFYKHRKDLLETEAHRSFGLWLVKKDGNEFFARLECDVITTKRDDGKQIRVAVSDITNYKQAEEALRESEEHYRRLLENGNDAIYIHTVNEDGSPNYFIDVNDMACKRLGYSREELLLKTPKDIDAPELRKRLSETIQHLLTDRQCTFEMLHVAKDGRRIPVEINASLFTLNNKKMVMSIARDISERKVAEEQLLETQMRTTTILAGIADTFYSLDNQWRFAIVNPAAEKAPFGRPAAELIGNVIWDLYPNLVDSDIHGHYLNAAEKHTLEHYESQSPLNGRWYEVFMQGWHGGVDVYMRDITEHKRIENALRESEELFRNLINSAPEGIFVQAKGCFLFLNPAMVKIFGATNAEDVICKDLMSLTAPEYHEAIRDRIRFQCETGKPAPLMDQAYLRVDGSRIPVETTAVPIQYQGSSAHLVFVRDITDRKKVEVSLQESETRYRSVLETINEGVVLQSATGEILTWNKGAENIFKIPAKEAIGRTSEGPDWPTIREDGSKCEGKDHPSMRTLQTGTPCRNQIMGVYQPSGELRWISTNTNPLFRADKAKPYAVVISFADITEIKKEKDQSQMYLDATTDGIWTWTFKKNTLFFSPKYYKMLGYAPDAFPADYDHWADLIHPDDREKALAATAEYLRTRPDDYENEFRLRTADGDYRWIHARAKVVERDTKGEAVLMVGNHEDITERKQAELALRESEEKFRLTFSSSPDAVNINRLRDGFYVDINDGFTQLTGFTREDVSDKTSLDVHIWNDPEDRKRMVQELQKKGFCDNLEAVFRRKDGSLTTALMSARVISLKNEPHIISITRDISERKQAEAERERLLLAIEQADEIVVITDNSGSIQYVNPAFEKITGYSAGEAIGENPRLIKSGQNDEASYKNLWDTIFAGNPWTGRLLNKRKDGAAYTAECSISPVKDKNGNVINFVSISRDITNDLELERRISQAQKMESIGNLAGGIAHDFNNLLFPIIGMSELLLEDLPHRSQEYEHVQQILKAGMRGSDLVKQILAFSRQSEHKLIPVRPRQVLKEVMKLIRSTIPSYIEIEENIQSDCGFIMADPTEIHQVAMNILTNAFHAVEAKGGKIEVILKEVTLEADTFPDSLPGPGRYALLSITDTGHGISPGFINKIFEPYFTTKEQGKGTGIGLSVAYGIIRNIKGEIKVYSEVGKGTTFNIYLPLMEKSSDTDTRKKTETDPGGNERILLVDDEEAIIDLEKLMLERLGYHVTERTSSSDALKTFKANPSAFDLVISDMTMPNMTGDQLSRELITVRPDIPVILCTGFSTRIDQTRAESMGVKGFLMKPVVRSEMAKMVRKVLDETKNVA
jgi:PAS domain S-box-containing protein